jgi:anti-sigma-K factor RskA
LFDLTEDEVEILQMKHDKLQAELDLYLKTTPEQIWQMELVEFELEYKKWQKQNEIEDAINDKLSLDAKNARNKKGRNTKAK